MRQKMELRMALLLAVSVVLTAGIPGCLGIKRRAQWYPPTNVTAEHRAWNRLTGKPQVAYERAFAQASKLEAANQAGCVDYYYQAAVLAWPCVEYDALNQTDLNRRGSEIYHASLVKLIENAQKFGRFDSQFGLQVVSQAGPHWVPLRVRGFPWQPMQVDKLIPVGSYTSKDLKHLYHWPGLGVPLLAIRCPRSEHLFQGQKQHYPSTVLLRPVPHQRGQSPFALELIDTTRLASTDISGTEVALCRDLSAPFAYVLKDIDRQYLQSFLQPGMTSQNTGLFMIEPFQKGKIPVVFVHGLLSDRYTWANLANELRSRPDLVAKYQILGFEYSTGGPFMGSAALLRQQLAQFQMIYNPQGAEPALDHMVLIGHSMGGLVAKLQISESRDCLWRAVAQRPLDQIVAPSEVRQQLSESFFFEPVPSIRRVIYMGAPHRGSPWATRPVGKLGADLVEEPEVQVIDHDQLIALNPGVFSAEVSRRIPTSIDLLRPDSQLLLAMDQLPASPRVQQHSIIGSWVPMVGAGDSDGVVPVNSAIRRGAVTEKIIAAKHEDLHRSDAGVDEVVRILRLHAQQVEQALRSAGPPQRMAPADWPNSWQATPSQDPATASPVQDAWIVEDRLPTQARDVPGDR